MGLMGALVAETIQKGMMSVSFYSWDDGHMLVLDGIPSIFVTVLTWLIVATNCGLTVSTAHSAIGGVIAFANSTQGYNLVKWEKVGTIVALWLIPPMMSAFAGLVLYTVLRQRPLVGK